MNGEEWEDRTLEGCLEKLLLNMKKGFNEYDWWAVKDHCELFHIFNSQLYEELFKMNSLEW
jgi:hypothetical protein